MGEYRCSVSDVVSHRSDSGTMEAKMTNLERLLTILDRNGMWEVADVVRTHLKEDAANLTLLGQYDRIIEEQAAELVELREQRDKWASDEAFYRAKAEQKLIELKEVVKEALELDPVEMYDRLRLLVAEKP